MAFKGTKWRDAAQNISRIVVALWAPLIRLEPSVGHANKDMVAVDRTDQKK
jgi:hypothetical protein